MRTASIGTPFDWVTPPLFLERNIVFNFQSAIFRCCERHKQNPIHLRCVGLEEELSEMINSKPGQVKSKYLHDKIPLEESDNILFCNLVNRPFYNGSAACLSYNSWCGDESLFGSQWCIYPLSMPQTLYSYTLNWYSSCTEMTMKRVIFITFC